METLKHCFPAPPDWTIPWSMLAQTALAPLFRAMAETPQNPQYHAEGDVMAHTRLVCEALCAAPDFRALPEEKRQVLFLAALLHDVGKISCTRMEDGVWVSPHHAAAGAQLARRQLWTVFGLCGNRTAMEFREAVCALIRRHTLPAYAILREDGELLLRCAAAEGTMAPAFDLRMLCLLAEADACGRLCADRAALLERIRLCGMLAEECGCGGAPYAFPSPHTAFAYFSGRNVAPSQVLYDDTWGEVTLLAGLPGTGKDTWIAAHCPDLPQISLDRIRAALQIAPTEPQGRVADAARAEAKMYLRQRRPFVWNATNVTEATRRKLTALCAAYGASVRIVYLETDWETLRRRNSGRRAAVPERAICRMLEKLTPPSAAEAHRVLWQCV